jgi:UDP-N-acetylglucosamine 2-epimerase (non-hydrolysing)/GDP/UDP-N,N'-diacetylbacillosamine 2-epimerase (hydrolysing)
MSSRKICIVTGTRAEYGLFYWLMKEIEKDASLTLQILVTGSHLAPQFGKTVNLIEDDGFCIQEYVNIEVGDDTPVGISRSMGLALIGIGEALERLKPDIVVVLGDRYEILAATSAAIIAHIPVAHIHGGEITEGVIDDAMRHAITKMAHLHFTAAETYRARVIQLGEMPERVFDVGAPGLDNFENLELFDRTCLEAELGIPFDTDFFLVTLHPTSTELGDPGREAKKMLVALDKFLEHRIVFTGVNADRGSNQIADLLSDYANKNKDRVSLYSSLGQVRYLSAMKYSSAVIGNSSSGIIEAPAIKTPTVNIGNRQKGRLRCNSILDCKAQSDEIAAAISQALHPDFQKRFEGMKPPYGSGGVAKKIKGHLKSVDLETLNWKSFHNAPFEKINS